MYTPMLKCSITLATILLACGVASAQVDNDACIDATLVSDGTPAVEGDNAAASAVDDAEASCQGSDYDVWFEYVATCTGSATADTFGSGQSDTVLSVYDACGGNEIACNDDTGGSLSQVTFATVDGNPYWIRLASAGAPGDYDLNITCTSGPPNDDCSSATAVTGGSPAAEGDNSEASGTDDDEASCQSSDSDVWFTYLAVCDGPVTVDTFDSGQEDTVLSVYEGCGGTEIACNDDTGGLLSQVTFDAAEAMEYKIRLGSFGAPGDYDLNILLDDCNTNDLPDCVDVSTDGLVGTYYPLPDFAGTPEVRVDPTIDFDWGNGEPFPGFGVDDFTIRWTGYVLTEPAAGTYTFTTWTDDGVRLWVDGQLLIDNWTVHAPTWDSGMIDLEGSTEYAITMEYFEAGGGAVAQLYWTPPGGPVVLDASGWPGGDHSSRQPAPEPGL